MKTRQLCVLCGESEATTRDHIPPKSIYPEPRANDIDLHTVPACANCNCGASTADEEFKVIISIDTSHNRGNEDLLVDSVARSVGKNRRIAKDVLGSARRVYAALGGSGLLQPAVDVAFPKDAYESVIRRIVKGLYWTETGQILPGSATITVRPCQAMPPNLVRGLEAVLRDGELRFLNKGTFAYRCLLSAEEQSSIWGMCFFHSHTAYATASWRDSQQ